MPQCRSNYCRFDFFVLFKTNNVFFLVIIVIMDLVVTMHFSSTAFNLKF